MKMRGVGWLATVVALAGLTWTGMALAGVAKVYVADEEGDTVTVLDATSFKKLATIAVGREPHNVQVSPDGRWAWLTVNGDAGTNDPDLLGLFCGYSLREMDDGMMGAAPNTNCIYLFQRNIERYARDRQDLVEQIRITLYHEFGHYLGFDEDGVDELGLG